MIFLKIQIEKSTELFSRIHKLLIKASDERKLNTPPHDILKILKMIPRDQNGFTAIYGGGYPKHRNEFTRNFKRLKEGSLYFEKSDKSWFDFVIIVKEISKQIEIISYNFEIRIPLENGNESFIRFDLNPVGHGNDAKGIRSHMHCNSDQFQFPYPEQSPLEILDMLLFGIRNEIDNRKK